MVIMVSSRHNPTVMVYSFEEANSQQDTSNCMFDYLFLYILHIQKAV